MSVCDHTYLWLASFSRHNRCWPQQLSCWRKQANLCATNNQLGMQARLSPNRTQALQKQVQRRVWLSGSYPKVKLQKPPDKRRSKADR